MEKEIKNQHQVAVQKGCESIVALKSAGEELYLDPNNWMLMAQAIKVIFESFFGWIGLGKSKEIINPQMSEIIVNQQALLKIQERKIEEISKIREHLEKTCLSKGEVEKIMSDFSVRVAEDVATEIPGQLLSVEAEIPAQEAKKMRFVRRLES